MKIQYHNVGSIRDAEIEYNLGKLILIRGETNHGKSLIFYSLADGLLNNPTFKKWHNKQSLIENPNSSEKIILYTDDNNKYEVELNSKGFRYRINDNEPVEKVQRKNIYDILNRQIKGFLYSSDEENPLLNIVQENEGFFPINRSDSQIYKTYERLLSLNNTQEIMKSVKMDIEDIQYHQKDNLIMLQKYQAQQSKLSEALNSTIDENYITQVLITITKMYNDYIRVQNICSFLVKDINYIHTFSNSKLEMLTKIDFDALRFNRLLNLYIQDANYQKSNKLLEFKLYSVDIDIDKIKRVNISYNNALNIQSQIQEIYQNIQNDISLLEEIDKKLKDVKVCPLCGQSLGDNHDQTVHSK